MHRPPIFSFHSRKARLAPSDMTTIGKKILQLQRGSDPNNCRTVLSYTRQQITRFIFRHIELLTTMGYFARPPDFRSVEDCDVWLEYSSISPRRRSRSARSALRDALIDLTHEKQLTIRTKASTNMTNRRSDEPDGEFANTRRAKTQPADTKNVRSLKFTTGPPSVVRHCS